MRWPLIACLIGLLTLVSPTVCGQTKFDDHLQALEKWLDTRQAVGPELNSYIIDAFVLLSAGENGPSVDTITIGHHEIHLATMIDMVLKSKGHPSNPKQEQLTWQVLHEWLRESGLIDQAHFDRVEAVRLNTKGSREKILNRFRR